MSIDTDPIIPASQKFPRRNFPAHAANAAILIGQTAYIAKELITQSLLTAKPREVITKPAQLDIFPGWIGAGQTVFLDAQNGPDRFLRSVILENPTLKKITQKIMEDFAQAYQTDRKFRLDEILALGLGHAREVFLNDIDPSRISTRVNPKAETLLAASTALAFACSGWPTERDYRELGLGRRLLLLGKNNQDSFWQGDQSIGRRIFPQVLPDPNRKDGPEDETSAGGEDRVRHFTVFSALYQLVLSSMEQKTNLEKTFPTLVKAAAGVLAYKEGAVSNARKAAIFCELFGLLYEIKGTLSFSSLILPGQDPYSIKSGLTDPASARDLYTNAIAIKFGKEFRDCVKSPSKTLDDEAALLAPLRDPSLSHFKVRPLIQGLFLDPRAA